MSPTHELVHVTHPLGAQEQALAALRDERAHSAHALLGVWAAETGVLNRVVALWSCNGSEGEAGTLGDDDWSSGGEVRQRMTARRALDAAAIAAPIVELRQYAPHAGKCEAFVAAMLDALPHRERYSPCAGMWTTRERGHDVVVHMWAYRTFDERVTARTAAMRNDAWGVYRKAIRPMLASMRSTLLTAVSL